MDERLAVVCASRKKKKTVGRVELNRWFARQNRAKLYIVYEHNARPCTRIDRSRGYRRTYLRVYYHVIPIDVWNNARPPVAGVVPAHGINM